MFHRRFYHNDYEDLIYILKEKRKTFASIGTNKAKRRLNKLSKENEVAKAIRKALEIEDKNILAKDHYGKYKDKIYNVKNILILELVHIFKENKWVYGIQKNKDPFPPHIIYFEIPNCEQISWHFDANKLGLPKYNQEWDKEENSTLRKLEKITKKILKENGLLEK